MENRIENNLKSHSKTVLVNLPQDAQIFTLDEFVEMQEEWIREESEKLKSKNYEVEYLIQTIYSYQPDKEVLPNSAEEVHESGTSLNLQVLPEPDQKACLRKKTHVEVDS